MRRHNYTDTNIATAAASREAAITTFRRIFGAATRGEVSPADLAIAREAMEDAIANFDEYITGTPQRAARPTAAQTQTAFAY